MPDDLASTATIWTGLDILHGAEHGLLGVHDLPFTITLGAGLLGGSGFRACTMTGSAFFFEVDLDLLLTAKDRLLKA